MSRNNGQNDNSLVLMMVIGMVVAAITLAMFVYALLVFAALIMTILYAFGLERSFTLGGIRFDRAGAVVFFLRGAVGAVFVPAFAVFCEIALGVRINPAFWPHFFLGGYACGSLGIALLEDSAQADAAAQDIQFPPVPQLPPQRYFIPHEPEDAQSFRFANWDDEEELRKRDASPDDKQITHWR